MLSVFCFLLGTQQLLSQEIGLTEELDALARAPIQQFWQVTCRDELDRETCIASYSMFADQSIDGETQRLGRVLLVAVLYGQGPGTSDSFLALSLNLPLGVDLQVGAVIRVDEEEEIQLPYLQCTLAGCAVSVPMDEELLTSLKMGRELRVGFRALGSSSLNIVSVPLDGFTKAFSALEK
jgi:invasion protein IalB